MNKQNAMVITTNSRRHDFIRDKKIFIKKSQCYEVMFL